MKGILPMDYHPRWQKHKHKYKKIQRCVPHCIAEVRGTYHKTVCECLGIAVIPIDNSSLPVCQSHYSCVYRLCNQEKTCSVICKVCGVKLKHDYRAQRFRPSWTPKSGSVSEGNTTWNASSALGFGVSFLLQILQAYPSNRGLFVCYHRLHNL